MKSGLLGTALLLAGLTAGCASDAPTRPVGAREMWVGDSLRAASIHRAIVVQRTLYPYHFVDGSPELNDLGLRDLRILADHFREHPGKLNLARGSSDFDLYAARTRAVLDALVAEGLDEGRLAIEDGTPGGDGMSGGRLVEILAPAERSTTPDLSALQSDAK